MRLVNRAEAEVHLDQQPAQPRHGTGCGQQAPHHQQPPQVVQGGRPYHRQCTIQTPPPGTHTDQSESEPKSASFIPLLMSNFSPVCSSPSQLFRRQLSSSCLGCCSSSWKTILTDGRLSARGATSMPGMRNKPTQLGSNA